MPVGVKRGMQLGYLELVAAAAYCAGRAHDAYVAVARYFAHLFDGGAYDTEHAAVGVDERQIVLLNRAKRLGRCGVAGENHQMTSLVEEVAHGFECEAVHDVKRARAVGRTRVVAEIYVVILRQQLPYLVQYSESAVA